MGSAMEAEAFWGTASKVGRAYEEEGEEAEA